MCQPERGSGGSAELSGQGMVVHRVLVPRPWLALEKKTCSVQRAGTEELGTQKAGMCEAT